MPNSSQPDSVEDDAEETVEARFTALVRVLGGDTFTELMAVLNRESREACFRRHQIRATTSSGFSRPGQKQLQRVHALFTKLLTVEDETLCEELLRSWLLSKRPLLAATLDELKIPHVDGLTESDDVNRLKTMSDADIRALAEVVRTAEPDERAVWAYFAFMGSRFALAQLAERFGTR